MNRVSRYLLKHFSELFSSLFFILFFITSVVFFIKLTAMTAIIKMNFLELGTLYIYLLPRTLIYTLPLTFFIALCITLFNLSKENETIVLFTLGYNPKKIATIKI
jgi:lipopolysaccharide export system permease protein